MKANNASSGASQVGAAALARTVGPAMMVFLEANPTTDPHTADGAQQVLEWYVHESIDSDKPGGVEVAVWEERMDDV